MQVGGSGTLNSNINVTPLVDVVLVLLIIFMVITPVVQMGYLVRVPPKAPANLPPSAIQDQIVLRLLPDARIFINKDEVPADQFPAKLREIMHGNTSKMIFPVDQCIEVLSLAMTLLPGDIIATGTPDGVGAATGNFLKAGDRMEAEVEKIGVLANKVVRP